MKYLILHKVSGEPAFDIAKRWCEGPEPCQPKCGCYPKCKEEEMWIIPTSGHRAYPYKMWKLDDLADMSKDSDYPITLGTFETEMPSDWPDHYQNAKGLREPSVDLSFGEMMKALVPQGSFPRRA